MKKTSTKRSSVTTIKQEQKKSFLLQEISALVRSVTADEPKLSFLFVTRVETSSDGGICYVYCSSYKDRADFEQGLEILKLYKPSMRKALSQAMHSRYVPNIIFRYDESKEKTRRVDQLLDEIIQEREKKEDD